MRALSVSVFVFLLSLLTAGGHPKETSSLYFNQASPGDTAVVFAKGVISKKDRFEQFLQFSPDGKGLVFGVTDGGWSKFSLHYMNMENGHWTEPIAAPFLGSDTSGLTSCLSFDMRTAFFTAARPSYPPCDIWMSKRGGTGWSKPEKVGPPVSSKADEFEVAISRNGTLYFSSKRGGGEGDMDIYRARLVDGAYPEVENLGPAINAKSGDDLPYIAPDESYLIFASNRPGGFGSRDLYISFQIDGAWTEPKNLGSSINSEYWDIYPSVSPDGKYLFFARRKAYFSAEDSDIYWVSAGFIDRMKKTVAR